MPSSLNTAVDFAGVEVLSVKQVCPMGRGRVSCKAVGSFVNLKVTLLGCADRMGQVLHSLTYDYQGKPVLNVAAVNIRTKRSERVRCLRAKTETKQIFVGVDLPRDLEVRQMNVTL